MKRVCAKDGEEVEFKNIVKGYELAPDQYVVIKPEELDALDPEASRSIDILDFVPLDQIDPLFFENAYYLVPDEVGAKAYALLLAAMRESRRVAVASMVMRQKQYLAAIRPTDKALALSTLLYHDEVVAPDAIEGLPSGLPKVDKRELQMAEQLIETLAADFTPEKYKDEYRARVLELIEKRAAGETITVHAPEVKAGKPVDLADALEQTLKMVREKKAKAAAAASSAKAPKPAKAEGKEAKAEAKAGGKRGAK
jgi:DNA end-binding protein Ku